MDKLQARQLIKDTFENSFDRNGFIKFIKNLLNQIDDAPTSYQGQWIPDSFKPYISKLERIGKYNDGENKIDILIIKLQRETSLERARTMQRNFVAWYLNGSRGGQLKDAALVAFVSPNESDWRFSLVKMDYKFEETKTGKIKVKEEFTPARRWSFLVGSNEKSHTAQSKLVDIVADDEQNPTLARLEKVFNIETVTREFFIEYRNLFIRTKKELDKVLKNDSKLRAEFEAKGVDTVNFSKKLLGQIVFLYFLQKKGWFGVPRDANWGEGSKQFLRELFEKKLCNYNNFFNEILEPLFYEALRIDRSHDDHYYSRFNCKIPFLNGGLFDPIGSYDWVHTDIILPNELFSNNKRTSVGDIGDGILDVFDRFNFTVAEDEPLEKEVAIDPELLGKTYEKFNAIRPDNFNEYLKVLNLPAVAGAKVKSGKKGEENKFNKQYGVYYTPREIVHYMCQQSLINYLATELDGNVNKEVIEFLILEGERFVEYLSTAKEKLEKNEGYAGKYQENKHFIELRPFANEIDQLLAKLKMCDPAVGSGAFPVGMMNEIVKARMFFVLTNSLKDEYKNLHGENVKRNPYNFKRECIENSLYGVDIDPGAVEIAKLRLWLSLVVDEDDISNIKPLPNLDYKIVCGNSLLGVEKNLFNEK
ncbi:MAG: class I SAM-dependent DNA methyltransferase, partial [Ignavibacteria bacterium]|nr:class I SAM-dependent DNA methyltransferase [Ignavibacteria bacterium]